MGWTQMQVNMWMTQSHGSIRSTQSNENIYDAHSSQGNENMDDDYYHPESHFEDSIHDNSFQDGVSQEQLNVYDQNLTLTGCTYYK